MKWCACVQDMKEAEGRAFEQGTSQEELIRRVAKQIYAHNEFQKLLHGTCPILLLIGRGLNGLDGLALGCELLRAHKNVVAYQLTHQTQSPLSVRFLDEFSRLGGRWITLEEILPDSFSLVVDGLLGTGAKQVADPELHEVIGKANKVLGPIVSIDVPSGVAPDTGEIWDVAISADYTFACQAPKKGLFFQTAWEKVGTLIVIDIGLAISHADMMFLEDRDGADVLPAIERMTHKYRRGTVHIVAGSQGMMGAACLSIGSAFASGAGYVHSYVPLSSLAESVMLPIEAVRTFYNPKRNSFSLPEKGALIVGPGLGTEPFVQRFVKTFIQKTQLPLVIDGDGLRGLHPFLANHQLDRAILTPHRKEAERLFGFSCEVLSQTVVDTLRTLASSSGACIILKGAPTVICTPDGGVEIMGLGSPALATAGSGDVLTGILGALLAQGLSREYACRLGTLLHACAGHQAAKIRTTYAVQARHVMECLPLALQQFLNIAHVSFQTYKPVRLMS